MAEKYKDQVEIRRSEHELHLDALFVAPHILKSKSFSEAIREAAYGEIAHIHYGFDFSAHVVSAPLDCKSIIENGKCEVLALKVWVDSKSLIQ